MARRKPHEGNIVSLFPFLSILACVIGVLTLLISALALGQMDPQGLARRESYQRIKDQMQIDLRGLERLKKLVAEAETIREQIKEAQAELARLKAEAETAAEQDPLFGLLAESARLRKEIDQLRQDISNINAQIDKTEAEIQSRKSPSKETRIIVLPSGTGRNITAFFVECRQTSILLHLGEKFVIVRRSEMARNEAFLKLIEEVKATPNGSIIFLIRPDAVGTYYAAERIAQENYCRNGKLPLHGFGELDLRFFKQLQQTKSGGQQ